MKVLVTGGMGFIGSHFVRRMLRRHPGCEIWNLDAMKYAAHPDNLRDVERDPRYRLVKGDIADKETVERVLRERFDAVVHFAAESHVDRSISDPEPFIVSNIVGTFRLLDGAVRHGVSRFVLVSTDEVYGSAEEESKFAESDALRPSSPYSASKASADLIALAYRKTYGLPVIITRCSNNYGPRQYPEKLIPKTILRALAGRPVPVYGDGMQRRDWLYVEDHCAAVELLMHEGKPGEIYNICAGSEYSNLEIVRAILGLLGKDEGLIRHIADRPGHDQRYALDDGKLRSEHGWRPQTGLKEGLEKTVRWYVDNRSWWQNISGGASGDGGQGG